MVQYWFNNPKVLVLLTVTLVLLVAVACGTTAPAAPQSPPTEAAPSSASGGGGASQPVVADTPTPTPEPAQTPASDIVAEARGVLRIGNKDLGPPQFLPKNMAVPQCTYITPVTFDALWSVTPDGVEEPSLIEEWSVSDDGLTWRLKLREGIPFHKGWGIWNAHDYVWAIDNILEEGGRHPLVPHMRRIYRAEGASVKVIDDYTVEVNTGDAVAFDFTWRNRLNGANCPVPSGSKKYFEEVGEERATMEGIGTGPWQFVEFRTNERFISEAVEDHWRKTPFFKELHYFQIPEESTRVANFLAGELDTMQMALGSIPALLDAPGVKFQRYPDALELHMNLHGQRYIDREGIPARNPDFPWISASADPNSPEWEQARKVREALSISINRQLIVDSVLEGEGRADNPYWRWGGLDRFFDEEMRNTQVVYDVDRARQLLEEAGYGDGFTIPIALTQRSYPGTPAVGEAVCLMWEQINVTCEQQRMAMTAFRPTFVARTGEGFNTHDNSPAEEPIAAYSNIISSKGLINFGAEHPWLDEMVAKAEKTGDFEKRMEIQREIAKFIQM